MWLHSSFSRASHRYRGGHGFESRRSLDFFQPSSFRLLKLDNLLRWSFFTLIYNYSSNIRIISYIPYIISLIREIWTQWIDLAPNVLWSQTLGARSIYWVHLSGEEWNDVKYIWDNSVKVLITAGANIVLYNEGAVITICFRRLLSSWVHMDFNTNLFRRLTLS